jgi:hypothetical protein
LTVIIPILKTIKTKTYNKTQTMKKILITALSAVAMVAGVSNSFAQGQVTFNNNGSTLIILNNGTTTAKMYGTAGTYDIGLYMGASGTSNLSQMTLVDVVASPNALSTAFNAGQFAGGSPVLTGIAAGTQFSMMAAFWSASSGSDYLTALASGTGYVGLSGLGFITPQVSPATIPVVFGTGAGQLGGFTANLAAPSPEPATIALGGLGAAALLMFRRRK